MSKTSATEAVAENNGEGLVRASDVDPRQLELMSESLRTENRRIDLQNRRADYFFKGIELEDAQNRRQHEYHTEDMRRSYEERRQRREADEKDRRTRRNAGFVVVGVGALAAIAFAGVFVWMAFLGDSGQRETAGNLLVALAGGVGGFGLGWISSNAARRFFAR